MAEKKRQEHKLMRVLNALSKAEWQQFAAYLNSGLEPVRPQVRQFFTYLQKHPTAIDQSSLLQKYLYPSSKQWTEQQLNNKLKRLRSELYELLKNYLSYINFKQQDTYQEFCFLDMLHIKNIYDIFDKEWNRLQKKQAQQQPLTHNDFLHQLLYQQTYVHHNIIVQNRNPENQQHIANLLHHIEDFSLLLQLKYGVAYLGQANVLNASKQLPPYLHNALFKPSNQSFFDSKPILIQLYYYLYLFFTQKNAEHWYHEIKERLTIFATQISSDDKRHIYTFLLTYCGQKISQGYPKYTQEAFSIYRKMFEEKIVYASDGYFHPAHFKNFIRLATQVGQLNEVQQFVEATKNNIRPPHRINAYKFYSASILFAEKKFVAAEVALRKIYERKNKREQIIDFYYNINGRILRIQALYEIKVNYFDDLERTVNAFKRYIQDNESIEKEKQYGYKQFVRIIKRLCNKYLLDEENRLNKKQRRVTSKAELLADVQKTNPLAEKRWLLEKVEELGVRS